LSRYARVAARIALAATLAGSFLSCATNGTPKNLKWPDALAVNREAILPLKMNAHFIVPEFPVAINGQTVFLEFDTGTPHGFMLTDPDPAKFGLETISTARELNADGSDRGARSLIVRADTIEVLGITTKRITGKLSDWKTYSSFPFSGLVSPELFGPRRISLDYRNRLYAISDTPVPDGLPGNVHGVARLIRIPERFGGNVYFENTLGGEPVVTYLDTGASHSVIDDRMVERLHLKWHARGSRKLCDKITFTIGEKEFTVKDILIERVSRSGEFGEKVMLCLGMDFLKDYLFTLDRTGEPLIVVSDPR
jgi:predicted aspartyl protease